MRGRLFFTVVILFGWIGFAYWFGSYTLQSLKRTSAVTMEIVPNSSLNKIGASLKARGIIRESYFFRIYALFSGNSNLKPGVYEIEPTETLSEILSKFSEGRQNLVKIVIPPSFTTLKLGERLEAHGYDKALFYKLMNQKKPKYAFEKRVPTHPNRTYRLEGYIVPGTYHFRKFAQMEDMINEMLDPFAKNIDTPKIQQQLAKNPNLPAGLTMDQLVTVASLIEREGQMKEELPRIAGVIYNRMRNPKNDRLRIDASIVYIYAFKGVNLNSINQKQILNVQQNPYNTYHHSGLPPGPIAYPSKEAIMAALHPEKHEYEYYVTKKDGTQSHYFSKTYAEHLKYDKRSQENQKKLAK